MLTKQFLLFLSVGFTQSFAQPTTPSTWNLRNEDGITFRSVFLQGRAGDSLFLLEKPNTVVARIDSLRWIEEIVGRKSGIAIPLGIAGGAAVGVWLSEEPSSGSGSTQIVAGRPIAIIFCAAVGGVLGGVFGTGEETERIPLHNKSPDERLSILDSILAAQGPIGLDSVLTDSTAKPTPRPPATLPDTATGTILRVAVKGGIAYPVGEFGMKSTSESGLAELGYVIGADVSLYLGSSVWWATGVSLTVNDADESAVFHGALPADMPDLTVEAGEWINIWPMTGIRVQSRGSSTVGLRGTLQVGAAVTRTPEYILTSGGQSVKTQPAWAGSFAFGIGIGLSLSDRFLFDISYLSASPEYEVTIVSGGVGSIRRGEQGIGLLVLTAGIGF